MPRGIPNKKVETPKSEIPAKLVSSIPISSHKSMEVKIDDKAKEERKEEVVRRDVLTTPKLEPLGPGQAYFEAPDGTHIIGEDSKNEIWYRAGNHGKGMWINKKR